MAELPLHGVRVLDLTQALAGPFATMILGDMGAEVIKIEPPAGDLTRTTPPHIVQGTSLYFLTNNRNKRSIVLDLKQADALAAFYQLCRVADIVMYNFSAGVADRLHIDANTLHDINAKLIVCNMTGYGRRGPDAHRRAVDPIIQSLAGAVSITGLPNGAPVRAGVPTADLSTGLYAVIGVLAALQERTRTGMGSSIETSLFHAQLSLLNYVAAYCAYSDEIPQPVGSGHPGTVPSQIFQTADGWITIDAGFDRHFQALCKVLNLETLCQTHRFATRQMRARHRAELLPILSTEIEKRTTAAWISILDKAGIPCGKVNNVKEALHLPQSTAYHALRKIEYRGATVQVLATPIWFNDASQHPVAPPPALGEHTEDILRSLLGYDDARIRADLDAGRVVVVTGFQGVDPDGHITTLGRGGSDTSAVAVAAALGAQECLIYTDVDGVYTTDPRLVPEARRLSVISFEEMLEMASLGAKVLQIRSVEFAGKYRIPVRVLSSLTDPDMPLAEEMTSGTLITFEEDEHMESAVVSGIAYSRDEAKMTLLAVPDKPGVAYSILGPVAAANIDIDMIVQNQSVEGTTDFSFTVHRNEYQHTLALLQNEVGPAVGAREVVADDKVCKVSIVGIGMRSHVGVASLMFQTLSEEGINIMMISTSEIKTSVLINDKYMELAVRALHRAFGLDAPGAVTTESA